MTSPSFESLPASLAAVLQLFTDTVLRISGEGVVLEYQPPNDPEFRLPSDKVVGCTLAEVIPGRYAEDAMGWVDAALSTGELQTATLEIPINSVVRELEVRVVPFDREQVIALVRDVTDRRRLEREILEISHREQQRIGQDLHDSLGQHLTGISFLSKALESKLTRLKLPEAGQAGEISQLVVETLGHTRNIARGLFPVELERTGRLTPALKELVDNLEKLFRVSCRLDVQEGLEVSDARVSTELFRITQEAISNAIKHGKAKRITVRLQRGPECTQLFIQDDGVGLQKNANSSGLGRRIMSFRAHRIGGRLEVASMDIGGTLVTCEFPNPAQQEGVA